MLPRRRDGEAVEVVRAALGAAQRAALRAARAAGPAAHRAPLHAPVALARSVQPPTTPLTQPRHRLPPGDLHGLSVCAVCCPPLALPDRHDPPVSCFFILSSRPAGGNRRRPYYFCKRFSTERNSAAILGRAWAQAGRGTCARSHIFHKR